MGKSVDLRQKSLNKLSGSHYLGACDAQNLVSTHAHTIGLPIRFLPKLLCGQYQAVIGFGKEGVKPAA